MSIAMFAGYRRTYCNFSINKQFVDAVTLIDVVREHEFAND